MEPLLTIDSTAAFLGVSRRQVYTLLSAKNSHTYESGTESGSSPATCVPSSSGTARTARETRKAPRKGAHPTAQLTQCRKRNNPAGAVALAGQSRGRQYTALGARGPAGSAAEAGGVVSGGKRLLSLISEPPTSEELRRRVLALLAARNGTAA